VDEASRGPPSIVVLQQLCKHAVAMDSAQTIGTAHTPARPSRVASKCGCTPSALQQDGAALPRGKRTVPATERSARRVTRRFPSCPAAYPFRGSTRARMIPRSGKKNPIMNHRAGRRPFLAAIREQMNARISTMMRPLRPPPYLLTLLARMTG